MDILSISHLDNEKAEQDDSEDNAEDNAEEDFSNINSRRYYYNLFRYNRVNKVSEQSTLLKCHQV